MARLNAGGWAAGILIFGAMFAGGATLTARQESREFEAKAEADREDARAFGLACPEKRDAGECERLCGQLYVVHASWSECVRAIVTPELVGGAPRPDPAPELAGGPEVQP
jgi:hypothetical protein